MRYQNIYDMVNVYTIYIYDMVNVLKLLNTLFHIYLAKFFLFMQLILKKLNRMQTV